MKIDINNVIEGLIDFFSIRMNKVAIIQFGSSLHNADYNDIDLCIFFLSDYEMFTNCTDLMINQAYYFSFNGIQLHVHLYDIIHVINNLNNGDIFFYKILYEGVIHSDNYKLVKALIEITKLNTFVKNDLQNRLIHLLEDLEVSKSQNIKAFNRINTQLQLLNNFKNDLLCVEDLLNICEQI